MALLKSIPQAFYTTIKIINTLSTQHIQSILTNNNADQIYDLSTDQIQSISNALKYIIIISNNSSFTPSELQTALTKETSLKTEIIELILQNCNKSGDNPSNSAMLNLSSSARYSALNYQLGCGIISSNCKQLLAPFINLQFELSNAQQHNIELDLNEFAELFKTFQDIQTQLEAM
jgi:hypothetical protein